MTSEKIGGFTVASLNAEKAWDRATVELYALVGDRPKGKVTHYVTYPEDVYEHECDGTLRRDVNGNLLVMYRKGTNILDDDGNPIVKLPGAEYFYTGRKSDDNGLVVNLPSCGRTHIDNLGYMGDEAFDVVFRAVAEEKMRRTAGGKPLNYFKEASISPSVTVNL